MKTVFFDVDTQIDFLFPAGALSVPGAAQLISGIAALLRFAAAHGIQVISTSDAHAENDPEFTIWKPHCVVDTVGQQKPASTLTGEPVVLSTSPQTALTNFAEAPQIIVQKQSIDCFTNPNLRPLLELLGADRYVVYGVVTEVCVQKAVLGLLASGARVEVVQDLVKSLDPKAEAEFFHSLQRLGGHLTNSGAVLS